MRRFQRFVAAMLAVSVLGAGLPAPAQAALIATQEAVASADRAKLSGVLDRAEVRAQLEALGVSPSEVKARVNALTDAEVAGLAGEIDQLPVGADGGASAIVGAFVLIFLVLLITDLLGLTKVFPFTKPIR